MKLKKKISLVLAFLMVLSIVALPASVFAEDLQEGVSYKKGDSYVTVVSAPGMKKDNYSTVITLGKNSEYHDVVRGSVFITYDNNTTEDLTKTTVKLKANKDKDITVNGKTIKAGKSDFVELDMTKSNKIIVHTDLDGTDEQWEYTISGAKEENSIDVNVSINVENPKRWLRNEYEIPGYPTDPPEGHADKDRVQKAVNGFDTLSPITYQVPKGTTAMEVLAKYGEDCKIDIIGIENGYISEMGVIGEDYAKIGEFDINMFSGWMYTLDEDNEGWYFPNVGASAKTLTKDTEMIWHFTMAYGRDIGAPWGDPGGDPVVPTMLNHQNSNYLLPLQWENSNRSVLEVQ